MSETNTEREPTEQELQAYRENMKKFYDQQIPFLKKQKEYEMLLADIEEARAKRITMSMRIAQIMAGPPEEPSEEEKAKAVEAMQQAIQNDESSEEESEETSPKPRKLKAK
jgi:hypothetical protein